MKKVLYKLISKAVINDDFIFVDKYTDYECNRNSEALYIIIRNYASYKKGMIGIPSNIVESIVNFVEYGNGYCYYCFIKNVSIIRYL